MDKIFRIILICRKSQTGFLLSEMLFDCQFDCIVPDDKFVCLQSISKTDKRKENNLRFFENTRINHRIERVIRTMRIYI